jgi:MHS family proline/betaine transporter-like MFS transporter
MSAAQQTGASATAPTSARSPWRSAIAAGLGSAIEYYDFQLYAVLAVFISPLFFPNQSPEAALLSTLLIFGGAFIVRPLGGMFFGWLGDRHGRRVALLITVIGMGFATASIGFVPGYLALGVLAPCLLLALRFAQGFFAGGEVTGAATYIAECVPPARRGFFGAFNPAMATLGLTLATAAAGLCRATVGAQSMAAWGWRIPLLLSVPLIAVCFWARSRIEDSPVFERLAHEAHLSKTPLRDVIGQHFPALLKIIGLGFAQNAAGYVGVVYLSIHMTRFLKYDATQVFWLISSATLLAAFLMPLSGGLSDRVGRRAMLAVALIGYIVLAPATMYVVGLGDFPLACVAVVISMLPFVMMQSVGYPLYAEIMPSRVRYSGVALGFNLAAILGGATGPYIATWLVQQTGNPLAPAFYIMLVAVVGLVTLATVSETAGKPLAT